MKIEIEFDDNIIKDAVLKQVQSIIKGKVDNYMNSSATNNYINTICKQQLDKLAVEVVMTGRIKELMEKKTTEVLPTALNDKFVGAYMSVVISEARKQAADAAQEFKKSLAVSNI